MIFCKERRAQLKLDKPDLPFGQLGKRLGEMWRSMTAEEKRMYVDRAAGDRERYKEEMNSFLATTMMEGSSDSVAKGKTAHCASSQGDGKHDGDDGDDDDDVDIEDERDGEGDSDGDGDGEDESSEKLSGQDEEEQGVEPREKKNGEHKRVKSEAIVGNAPQSSSQVDRTSSSSPETASG